MVTFWNNAKVEMLPPKLSEWPAIKKSFIGLKEAALKGKFLDITVKEATVNTLVAVEIAFWFYVGEVIGRRSLIGYNVWRTFKMYWLFQYFLTECVAKPFDVCVKKIGFGVLVSWPGKYRTWSDLSLFVIVFCFVAYLDYISCMHKKSYLMLCRHMFEIKIDIQCELAVQLCVLNNWE